MKAKTVSICLVVMMLLALVVMTVTENTEAELVVFETKLTAGDAEADDMFGQTVSISGNTIVVGAFNEGRKGAAYVYVHNGTDWIEEAKLTANDGEAYDMFGWSVSVSGNTAIIGAPGHRDAGNYSGSAYIFTRNLTSWVQVAKLTASDAALGDNFGWSVSIDGDTAVVGAHLDDTSAIDSGSVYVFDRPLSGWVDKTEDAKLTPTDAASDDMFGTSVSVSGNIIIAGAPGDDDAGSNSGSAYVFEFKKGVWSEQDKITAIDAAEGDEFGHSVSVDTDTAIIGAPKDDVAQQVDSGSAYIFAKKGKTWDQETKLTASDATSEDEFGFSVSISGNMVVIGTWLSNDAGSNSGSAYVFEKKGANWNEEGKLTASDADSEDQYGRSVSVDEGIIVVGSWLDDDDGSASGSAYVYEAPPANEPLMILSKEADVTTANPGDTITYTITYENLGGADAANVVIEDTIPTETTFVSATPMPDMIIGDVITWNIGTVPSGGSGIITLTVSVDVGVPDETVLKNFVKIIYSDIDQTFIDREDAEAEVEVTAPVLIIAKAASLTHANPGDTFFYIIEYENIGSGIATNVIIVDTIDPQTTYVSASPVPNSIVGNVLTWNLGNVAPGFKGLINITVTIDVGTPDQTALLNEVILYYADANGNQYPPETDSAIVMVTAPVMTLTKTADVTTAEPGDLITYTIEYANIGTGDATSVIIIDTIPADTSFVSSNPAYDSVSGDSYRWNIPLVPAGSSGIITITVMVDNGTQNGLVLRNWAYLIYSDTNGNFIENLTDYSDVTVLGTGEIHGMKWNDLDGDGVKDPGEPGLPNWTIFLDYDWDGVLDPGEPYTYTDQNGNYVFTGLSSGNYSIDEVHFPGWTQTFPNSGYHLVYVGIGGIITGLDFGNTRTASGEIHGMKWNDLDGDGVKDPGEPGLPNWTNEVERFGRGWR
jgi:uncharacterized repeat protein (TIGR01451 family)